MRRAITPPPTRYSAAKLWLFGFLTGVVVTAVVVCVPRSTWTRIRYGISQGFDAAKNLEVKPEHGR